MTQHKRIVGAGGVDEDWGPALKESGFEYLAIKNPADVNSSTGDCVLLDARHPEWIKEIPRLKAKITGPLLSVVDQHVGRDEMKNLRAQGSQGYMSGETPAEEVVVRLRAMLEKPREEPKESRAARRVWFQQKVKFKVFDREYSAWSTTLSETGIFLRTTLSFPLYSMIQCEFYLFGEPRPFKAEGVIVRQEVEGEIRGIGVMFQNLTGENVRLLESFLELTK